MRVRDERPQESMLIPVLLGNNQRGDRGRHRGKDLGQLAAGKIQHGSQQNGFVEQVTDMGNSEQNEPKRSKTDQSDQRKPFWMFWKRDDDGRGEKPVTRGGRVTDRNKFRWCCICGFVAPVVVATVVMGQAKSSGGMEMDSRQTRTVQ